MAVGRRGRGEAQTPLEVDQSVVRLDEQTAPDGTTTLSASRTTFRDYDGAKVFSATMPHEREHLGERVTTWLRSHPEREVLAAVVTQSSDKRFHCVTMTVFWRGCPGRL